MAAKTAARADTPAHPGTTIAEDVLRRFGLTQDQLAKIAGVSRRTVNQLVNYRRNLTADMALRIAKVTGTDARDWLERQLDWDLWQAERGSARVLAKIETLKPAGAAAVAVAVAEPAAKPKKAKAPAKPAKVAKPAKPAKAEKVDKPDKKKKKKKKK